MTLFCCTNEYRHTCNVQVEIGDYTDLADLKRKIDLLPGAGGGTAIYQGIIRMHEMFKATKRFANKIRHRFTGIIMTDGSDGSTSRLIAAATAAHKDDINIISIGTSVLYFKCTVLHVHFKSLVQIRKSDLEKHYRRMQ